MKNYGNEHVSGGMNTKDVISNTECDIPEQSCCMCCRNSIPFFALPRQC